MSPTMLLFRVSFFIVLLYLSRLSVHVWAKMMSIWYSWGEKNQKKKKKKCEWIYSGVVWCQKKDFKTVCLPSVKKKRQLHLLRIKSIDFTFKWHNTEGLRVPATHLCTPSIIQREHSSFYLLTGPYVEHGPHRSPLTDLLNSPLCLQWIASRLSVHLPVAPVSTLGATLSLSWRLFDGPPKKSLFITHIFKSCV